MSGCSVLFEESQPGSQAPCEESLAIRSDGDDGEIGSIGGVLELFPNGEVNLSATYLGFWDGTKTAGYYRFALPNGLQAGAPLDDVRLILWGKSEDNWDRGSDQLVIQMENVPDATRVDSLSRGPFADDSGVLLESEIVWPASGGLRWIENDFNESNNLAPMFEALADAQDGIDAGAHIMLWVSGNFSDGNREVATEDFFTAEPFGRQAQLRISRCEA